jgi:isoleucyl-tRNA synthetase
MMYKVVKDDNNEVDSMFKEQKSLFDKAIQGEIQREDAATEGALAEEDANVRDVLVKMMLFKL